MGCVLVFVVIGRASHSKGESFPGLASTSWPFLAGLAVGWLAGRAWRRPLAIVPAGVAAWLGTVAAGVVALVFLGLFVVGWRLAARQAAKFLPGPWRHHKVSA